MQALFAAMASELKTKTSISNHQHKQMTTPASVVKGVDKAQRLPLVMRKAFETLLQCDVVGDLDESPTALASTSESASNANNGNAIPTQHVNVTAAKGISRACQILWLHMNQDFDSLLLCGRLGAASRLVTTLNVFKQDADAAEHACHAIKALAITDELTAECGRANAVPVILTTLQIHHSNANVLKEGFGALWNLMANNPDNKTACIKGGAITAAVTAVYEHLDDQGVVELACGAIRKFVAFRKWCQPVCVSAGAVAASFAALQRHDKDVSIVHYTCATLADLAATHNIFKVNAERPDSDKKEPIPATDSATDNPVTEKSDVSWWNHRGEEDRRATLLQTLKSCYPFIRQAPRARTELTRLLVQLRVDTTIFEQQNVP